MLSRGSGGIGPLRPARESMAHRPTRESASVGKVKEEIAAPASKIEGAPQLKRQARDFTSPSLGARGWYNRSLDSPCSHFPHLM